jgi:gamma-glutamyltranspeptidase/glutathione hydrolase
MMRRAGFAAVALVVALSACSDPGPTPAVAPGPAVETAAASGPAAVASSATAAPAVEPPPPPPPNPPIELASGGPEAVEGQYGMVTTVEPNATRAAVAMLERGGNAVDAAVAAAYALAVTHPSAGNIGGGGFMIVRLKTGETYAIDFREVGPTGSTTEKVIAEVEAGGAGWASTAVPGTVAGLNLARDRFGRLPLDKLLEPSIKLAKKGHKLSQRAALSLKAQWPKLKGDPSARAIFGRAKGKEPLEAGDRVVQRELGTTLEAIAKSDSEGFYQGKVAEAIDAAMKKNGGLVTAVDLAAYKAKVREPLTFSYRGFTIQTMPPPSMGGVAIAETLVLLERLGAHDAPRDSGRAYHLFVESAKRAYADRRTVGADPDFYGDRVKPDAPVALLTGLHVLSRPIDPTKATPIATLAPELVAAPKESPETTHLSVVDAEGNAVSCTVTLSASFGAKVIVPGTGVLLSNALGGFSPAGPNDAAPGKRMASSMSPTIVSRGDKTLIVIGSPGGDTIPNVVTQVLRNLIDYRLTVDAAVKRGRVHHQLAPDAIRTEKGSEPPEAAKKELVTNGHVVEPSHIPLGDVKVIVIDEKTGKQYGFADRREGGLALAAGKPKTTVPTQ